MSSIDITANHYPTMLPGGTMPGSEGEGTWIGGNGGNMKGSSISKVTALLLLKGGNGGNMKGSSIASPNIWGSKIRW